MVKYESLLLGGMRGGDDEHTFARKETALKVARKVKASKRKGECTYGTGLSEQRLANLAKGRAVRAANIAAKKKQSGKGQYNQDYVDESQINYAGSPLDMYYLGDNKDLVKERKERGEIGMGARRGRGIEEELTSKAGGKLRKQKVKSPKARDVEKDDELEYTGGHLYTGMDKPTKEQFERGGKIKRGRKKIDIEDLEGGSLNVDVPDAIRVLGELASKFGLKLVR